MEELAKRLPRRRSTMACTPLPARSVLARAGRRRWLAYVLYMKRSPASLAAIGRSALVQPLYTILDQQVLLRLVQRERARARRRALARPRPVEGRRPVGFIDGAVDRRLVANAASAPSPCSRAVLQSGYLYWYALVMIDGRDRAHDLAALALHLRQFRPPLIATRTGHGLEQRNDAALLSLAIWLPIIAGVRCCSPSAATPRVRSCAGGARRGGRGVHGHACRSITGFDTTAPPAMQFVERTGVVDRPLQRPTTRSASTASRCGSCCSPRSSR